MSAEHSLYTSTFVVYERKLQKLQPLNIYIRMTFDLPMISTV